MSSICRSWALETATIPDISVNVNDVIEGESGKIYVATSLGVSVSSNYGKTWTSAFNVNQECIKLLKEISGIPFSRLIIETDPADAIIYIDNDCYR